jgi:hypothetical protein
MLGLAALFVEITLLAFSLYAALGLKPLRSTLRLARRESEPARVGPEISSAA